MTPRQFGFNHCRDEKQTERLILWHYDPTGKIWDQSLAHSCFGANCYPLSDTNERCNEMSNHNDFDIPLFWRTP